MSDDLATIEQKILELARAAMEEPAMELSSSWNEYGDPYPVLDLLRDAFGVELPMVEYLGATVADTAKRVHRMLQ